MHVLIMGAGGHGREVLDVLESQLDLNADVDNVALFVEPGQGSPDAMTLVQNRGYMVHESIAPEFTHYVPAVGDPTLRKRLSEIAEESNLQALTVVSPLSSVPEQNQTASGLVVLPHSYVSTNVRVGCHVHVNQGVNVSHDVKIGDFVSVGPGAILAGGSRLGDFAFLGAGAIVLPGVEVGPSATVGAGAVVVRDVAAGSTVAGSPARDITKR